MMQGFAQPEKKVVTSGALRGILLAKIRRGAARPEADTNRKGYRYGRKHRQRVP